jgi:drug/metabolite transporter (DMT)-like permease
MDAQRGRGACLLLLRESPFYVALAAAEVYRSGTAVLAQYVLSQGAAPLVLSFYKVLATAALSSLLLVAFECAKPRAARRFAPDAADAPLFVFLGVCQYVCNGGFANLSIAALSSTVYSLFALLVPMVVLSASFLLPTEGRVAAGGGGDAVLAVQPLCTAASAAMAAGLLVSACGVAAIARGRWVATVTPLGVVYVLVAKGGLAAATLLTKRVLSLPQRYSALLVIAASSCAAAACSALFALASAPAPASWSISVAGLGSVAAAGVGLQLLVYWLEAAVNRRVGPSVVSLFLLLYVFTTPALSAAVLGTQSRATDWVGGALLGLGLVLAVYGNALRAQPRNGGGEDVDERLLHATDGA